MVLGTSKGKAILYKETRNKTPPHFFYFSSCDFRVNKGKLLHLDLKLLLAACAVYVVSSQKKKKVLECVLDEF